MAAFAMTTTPLAARTAPRAARSPAARRGALVIRANGGGSSKGGEEGGRAFNNDAFGMIAKNANYGLFASAVAKVRRISCSLHPAFEIRNMGGCGMSP
jgi:hypothetical protein